MCRTRPAQGQNCRLRVASACPGVVNQEHVGALGKPGIRSEVLRVDVARMLGVGGGHQAYSHGQGLNC